ncbi:DUF3736 domain-containing protein [Caerostris extrusa]|uniref:DUF3736 domain-containing protein n=1 Tax=Caerostris extrusa TaxID=172846 RepID=A0AAV4U2A2_CAEEX|nr:DUF3736 domain-containing protein [Caerostris extrusa]
MTFSAQEPYTIPSKVPSNEKLHESLYSDTSSNKLPPYMLNEYSYMYQGDTNGYPSTFKGKEVLLARESKNQDVSINENEAHSFNEPVEKKRPPKKIEPEPGKSSFLSHLGLVTDSQRQALELKKCIRRHKILRERSLSPVEETIKKEINEYDSLHLAELSNRLCFSEDFQAKTEVLKSLGLMYLPPEQKKRDFVDMECCLTVKGVLIYKDPYCVSEVIIFLNNLKDGNNVKKPNMTQDESLSRFALPERSCAEKSESLVKDTKLPATSIQRLSSFLKPPMRTVTLPVPPLIPTSQIMSNNPDVSQNKNPSVVAAKDPRVRQLNKEFAQEFHNSVLQTTQMQLAEKKSIVPIVSLEMPFQKSPVSVISEKSDWLPFEYKPPLRWPGIEAIMESYECHISEQSMERKFLSESCQKLKTLNEKSNMEVECLRMKTEELIKEKHLLESKEQELLNSFEKLKVIIQHFR